MRGKIIRWCETAHTALERFAVVVFEWSALYILQLNRSSGQHILRAFCRSRVQSLAHRTFTGYRHYSRFSYSKRAPPSWVLLCISFPWLTYVSCPSWTVFLTLTLRCVCRSLIIYDIFVNCNWVVTRWQYYSTHLHTNNTKDNTNNN